ncbi:MAG: aminodeoxychorismate lyase [Oleiphilus sp.]|nr:MAG: aminodeoxychorismate lyase [Oleiphilus sp.]
MTFHAHKQAHTTLVNGAETSALTIADRGLAYGDGLFETMRVVGGEVPLLDEHLQRFLNGVKALALGQPAAMKKLFSNALEEVLSTLHGDALVKIIVTRGVGGRGYVLPANPSCNVITQVFDSVEVLPFHAKRGVSLVECAYRLPQNPALAGIKHLNRLDQVLAARSLKGKPEGLVFDTQDNLIEGTKSNVVLFESEGVFTPRLDACGVRGVLRERLLNAADDLGFSIVEDTICRNRLQNARAMVMLNSVYGLMQVKRVTLTSGEKLELSFDERAARIHQFLKTKLTY